MTPEILAAIVGGAIALTAALSAQFLAAHVAKRRRALELAGQYLGYLRSTSYLVDLAQASNDTDRRLAALDNQQKVVSVGFELHPIAPRKMRPTVLRTTNSALRVFSSVGTSRPQWQKVRDDFDRALEQLEEVSFQALAPRARRDLER